MHELLVDEIRINQSYTQHLRTEFPNGKKEEGKPKIRKMVVSTSNYLKKMSSGLDLHQGIMPPNCRYIEKLTNGTLVVIEEPPAYRTIKVEYPMNHELDILSADNKIEEWGIDVDYYSDPKNRPYNFNLAFPYVIHILMFDKYDALLSGQVFLRNARLAGFSDYLLKMPMMNISSEGYICYGDKAGGKRGSLNASIENTIMVFWSAVFNADYTYNYTDYKNIAGVNTYIGWQALSQIDPMFIYNVEWIKMERNLIQEIERFKEHVSARSKSSFHYEELARVFTQPADSGKEEKIRPRSRRTARLFYDIAQGIYLNDRFFFHVGDPVIWGKHLAHVDSFIGFFESDDIRFIRLQLDNGKLITVRYNEKVKDVLLTSARHLRFEEQGTLKNGVVIKEGDIINMQTDGRSAAHYRKVHFIRKARDGVTEARLGNSFYILENTEGDVVDLEAPKYGDLEIKKGEKYLIITGANRVPFHTGHIAEFEGINVNNFGSLDMEFTFTDRRGRGGKHRMNMNNPSSSFKHLYTSDEYISLPEVFRIGRKLMTMRKDGLPVSGKAFATPEGIVYDDHYEASLPTIQEVEKYIISEDGTVFSLRSFDLDIEFRVGDKVIQGDWANPINMLIPKVITAFTFDKNEQSLNFVLSDKEGRLSQVEYIKGTNPGSSSSNRAGIINIGRVRKITNKFGRLTSGTKIIAEKGYIPHFPKKDVNIIIGFITDTGGDDPLVLCSNCCTLWLSDVLAHFKRVTVKSKKWATLAHAPIDITKIKAQPGDIVNGISDYTTNFGWLVHRYRSSKISKIAALHNYTSYPDTYSLDTYTRSRVRFDCIPNPRISPTDQGRMQTKPAWPNFHGLFIESKISQFKFLEDERSLLHVSDPHK